MDLANTREKLRAAVDALAGAGSLSDRLTGAGVTLAAFLADGDFPQGELRQGYRRILAGLTRDGAEDLPAAVATMAEEEAQRWTSAIVNLFGAVTEADAVRSR